MRGHKYMPLICPKVETIESVRAEREALRAVLREILDEQCNLIDGDMVERAEKLVGGDE